MALPTCECVKGLPIGEQLAAIYCATHSLASGEGAPFIEVANVQQYGAVGDGVTDDTSAIQAAIDFAASPDGPRITYFPPGKYIITSTLILKKDSCTLIGAGQTSEIIVVGNSVSAVTGLYENNFPEDLDDGPHKWAVKNLVLTGPGGAISTGYGIYFENAGLVSANRVLIEDVLIRGFSRGWYGWYTVNTELNRTRIEDCPISIYNSQNDTLIIRNCWAGWYAGGVCIYSSQPGTGTIIVDSGEFGNTGMFLDCAANTGAFITINGPNWESFTGSYIAVIRGVGNITATNLNVGVFSGNASAIPFLVGHAQGSATIGSIRFSGANHPFAIEVVAGAEIDASLMTQDLKIKLPDGGILNPIAPTLEQSLYQFIRRAPLTDATSTAVAGGAADKTDGTLLLTTSTGATDAIHCRLLREVNSRPGEGNGTHWDRPLSVELTEVHDGQTNDTRFAVQLGRSDLVTAYAPLTQKGIGFEVTSPTTVSLFAHDGSSLTSAPFNVSGNTQQRRWRMEYDGNGTLYLYLALNWDSFEFVGSVGGGPTGNSAIFHGLLEVALRNNGATTAAFYYVFESSVWVSR